MKFVVGGKVAIRIPPELSSWEIETYEPEAIGALIQWLKTHPSGLLIDVGSSIGIFSVTAMFYDKSSEVIAIDANIASTAAVRRMCQYAPGPGRLTPVHGLITDEAPLSSLAEAVKCTLVALAAANTSDTTQFVHLHSASAQIPRYRLDDLVLDMINGRSCLIKCDVEGAELFVLRGARRLLSQLQPDLLLSVHCASHTRHLLAHYKHTAEDIRSFLESLGYHIHLLASDHEEHWWCTVHCEEFGITQ